MAAVPACQPPKQKWTRAKVPRVKTGCFTCNLNSTIYGAECFPLRPALSTIRFLDPSVASLFHHARHHTVEQFFQRDSVLEFWLHFVLPVSHSVTPLKYALCAPGGAHQLFLADCLGTSHLQHMADVKVAAILNYNRAIVHMEPILMQSSDTTLQITLACCIVFICIENLHGRHSESLCHLRAGSQVLASMLRSQKCTSTGEFGARRHFNTKDGILRTMSDILISLRQSMVLYRDDVVFPNQNYCPIVGLGESNVPFESLSQAENLTYDIEYACTGFPLFSEEVENFNESGSAGLSFELGFDRAGAAFHSAKSAYRTWISRYELLKNRMIVEGLSDRDRKDLAGFDLLQAIWAALIKIDNFEESFEKEDGEAIVQRADVVLSMSKDATEPLFALEVDVVYALAMVCLSCSDIPLQRRAISLLRSLHRREGLWDSQESAAILEASIVARETGKITWDQMPQGIPDLASTLSSLGLY